MMTNPWTINSESEIYTFLSYGHSSITTNYCNFIGALKKKIVLSVEDGTKVEPGSELAYTVTATTWARAEMNVTGACKLEILEGEDLVKIQGGKLTFGENEGKVVLLASYTAKMGEETYTLYEQPVEITIEKPKAPTSEENIDKELPPDNFTGPFDGPMGNVLLIGLAAVAAAIVGAVVIAVILKKKKH